MTADDLKVNARKWLRITSTSFDDEIVQTIEACEIDLRNAGVTYVDYSNTLVQQAMKLYLKAQFGYDDNADRFNDAYEHLKNALAIAGNIEDGDFI